MHLRLFVPALLAMLGLAVPAMATDLKKIDRRIGKEPAYTSKTPRYCLLVFGQEAKARVWVVLDGDTLYVDRNGNGDLTEEGEKVKLPEFTKIDAGFMQGQRQHQAGAITAWPARRLELMVMQMRVRLGHKAASPEEAEMVKVLGDPPGGVLTAVMVMDEQKKDAGNREFLGAPGNTQVALVDHNGALTFAERPQDAPIIHFHGPLLMTLHPMQKLVRGQDAELKAGVGTPGLGKGTFVSILYEGRIPNNAHPVADIEFPPAGPDQAPQKLRVELTKRC
ncbi:MAG: hypothetical protein IT429_03710 [Gemmataceae bacterium]|nr:hypothetical protein [Gemmataceae bacterium]